MASQPEIPHFGFPFHLHRADPSHPGMSVGHVFVVEQDDFDHVMACENTIVRCPTGFRVERPEFGIPWPEYRTSLDSGGLERALQMFEPRSITTGTEIRDFLNNADSIITLEVEY